MIDAPTQTCQQYTHRSFFIEINSGILLFLNNFHLYRTLMHIEYKVSSTQFHTTVIHII